MEDDVGASEKSISGVIFTKERNVRRIENPFSLKVGQVFTGFGIGCGIGIGVGRPLNLGAIPMLNQVMVAARGATDAFSGVGRHVNTSLRKFGAKNVEAGIGCGVGFGHGFGAGIALKPGAVHQLQSCFALAMATVMNKLGITPSLPAIQSLVPPSLHGSLNTVASEQSNVKHFRKKITDNASQSFLMDKSVMSSRESAASNNRRLNSTHGSRTDTVIRNFLENPILKHEDGDDISEMVLRHQKLIEKLMQENEKLHKIIAEDLKVSSRSKSPCDECFECRRRQKRR